MFTLAKRERSILRCTKGRASLGPIGPIVAVVGPVVAIVEPIGDIGPIVGPVGTPALKTSSYPRTTVRVSTT